MILNGDMKMYLRGRTYLFGAVILAATPSIASSETKDVCLAEGFLARSMMTYYQLLGKDAEEALAQFKLFMPQAAALLADVYVRPRGKTGREQAIIVLKYQKLRIGTCKAIGPGMRMTPEAVDQIIALYGKVEDHFEAVE